jgi:hypothetical protein
MKQIDLAYRTMFAELEQRSLDASFHADITVECRFVTVPVKGHKYWYFDLPRDGGVGRRYVGPQSDPEIARRVEAFQEIKDDLRSRRKLVSTLVREAGLPAPERFTGDIVDALGRAGLFRLRGVLVGTVAFQCYSGILGVRLASSAMQTGDVDFAQFHPVSVAVDDSLPPILDVLRSVDPSFREISDALDGRRTTQFENRKHFKVEFLTPNRGSADHERVPAAMPALGGASARPLRFLDFLIREPMRSVLLHKSGVPVLVPSPERYAVHKLIVAMRRRPDQTGAAKRDKDLRQAEILMQALISTRRQADLALAYVEARKRGPAWRETLQAGISSLSQKTAAAIGEGLSAGLRDISEDPAEHDLTLLPTQD